MAGTEALLPVSERVAEYVASHAGSFVTAAMVQRHARVGFARAAFELDRLAAAGTIGPAAARGRHAVPERPGVGNGEMPC